VTIHSTACSQAPAAALNPMSKTMKKPRDVIQPRWSVYLLRKKAERLSFTVTGRDAAEATERAIEEYGVPERERWRISVRREA
jgi:hypothetical protein